MIKKANKRSKERVMLKLELVNGRAGLFAADQFSRESMKRRGFSVGDELSAELRKPRDSLQWRRAHALGEICANNLDTFTGMDAHKVLKRLQLEARIGCEEIAYQVPGYGMVVQFIPMSLAFENMDEGEFNLVYRGFCQHIIDRYWPELDQPQIDEMIGLVQAA